MQASTLDRDLELAAALARRAGTLVVEAQARGLAVARGRDGDVVTDADRAASDLIVRGLRAAFPADHVISEEEPGSLHDVGPGRAWYVDPVDGTDELVRGGDGFAVMIGLAVQHRPVAGVVYHPRPDHLFVGAVGAGAWRDAASSRQPLQVTSTPPPTAPADRPTSVGLALMAIASGERRAYVYPSSRCRVWDTCAAEAIVVAAGGAVSDVWGDPLRYGDRDPHLRRGIVASSGRVHAAVIAALAEARRSG